MNFGPVCRVNSRSTRILPLFCTFLCALAQARTPLVLVTDFGEQDGAVALNQRSYGRAPQIESGPDRAIEVGKD